MLKLAVLTMLIGVGSSGETAGPECRRARDTFWDIQVAKMTALGDSL